MIYTVTSLVWDPDDRTLFYTTDNNAMRDLVRLDPSTGATEVLQKDARIGDLAFNHSDKSLWGIRHLNGFCTIVRIPAPYTAWEQIITLPYGTIVYDLDVSPDGARLSASFGEITGKQDVRVLNIDALNKGETTPEARFDFAQSVPNGFTFSPDGRYLYGSAYLSGVSNIFRYELANQQLEAVSNTETGFFRPVPLGNDALFVFRYTGAGFVPARIDAKPVEDLSAITFLGERLIAEHPVLQQWNVGSPLSIQYEALEKKQEPYGVLSRLGLESWFPVVQGYKDSAAIGARVNLSDPVGLNRASVTASYSPAGDLPASERIHLAGEYQRYDWRGRVELNNADFYDLFGPTKTSRKGYVASLGRTHTFLFDDPKRLALDLDASLSGNLDQLPEYQNVPVEVTQLGEFEANLGYRDLRSSLGKVDAETGVAWNTVAQAISWTARLSRGSERTSIEVSRCHFHMPRFGSAKQAASRPRVQASRLPTSSSAVSGTITSTTAKKNAIASITVCPAPGSTRSAAGISSSRCLKSTCPRCGSCTSVRPASSFRGCARRSLPPDSRRIWTTIRHGMSCSMAAVSSTSTCRFCRRWT